MELVKSRSLVIRGEGFIKFMLRSPVKYVLSYDHELERLTKLIKMSRDPLSFGGQ